MSRLFGESKLSPIAQRSERQLVQVYGSPGGRQANGDFLTQSVADGRYAATNHSHTISQVGGLQTALDGKLSLTSAADLYAAKNHTHTTAQISESGNLYFTTARAQAAISGAGPISVTAGQISISGINNTHIAESAGIAWSKISKSGALPGDVGALGATATAVNSIALGGLASSCFVQGVNQYRSGVLGAGAYMSAVEASGFYSAGTSPDAPNGSANWSHLIHCAGYAWGAPSHYALQISSSFSGGDAQSWGPETHAIRVITNGTPQPWRKLWHDGNLSASSLPGGPYLPLSGGTLTGALAGTTATFSGGIATSSATLNGMLSILPFPNGTTSESHWKMINRFDIFAIEKWIGGGHIATHLAFTAAGAATFSGGITAASFARPGGTSAQFLKADGSVDPTAYASVSSLSAYALSSSLPGLYQPLENQRVSTTSSVDFSSITTSGYINAHGIIYANATLRTAGLTVDSYAITANTQCQLNGTGWTVNAPMAFAVSPTPYGGALLGSSVYPWDAYVSRLRAGSGSIAIESPLAFGASARMLLDGAGWELPAPSPGTAIIVEGQSLGMTTNPLKIPVSATFGLYYRSDTGARTLLSAGNINMYGRTGLLIGGSDGNWHLLHV